MTKSPVGVNGIDPARQGIDPFPQVIKERSIDRGLYRAKWIDRIPGESGESLVNLANPWRTGRMPFAPTRSFVFDRNQHRMQCGSLYF